MKCKHCNSERITLKEWLGVGDKWMTYYCTKCNKEYHRTNDEEVLSESQAKKYGPVTFKTTGGIYLNLNKAQPCATDFDKACSCGTSGVCNNI